MQRELIVKSASLGGNSDLTLLAPITPGLVDSLEAVSHKTRIKRVLGLLHAARKSAHEHAAARLISDAVERVGVIHSVRVAVLEAEDKVLLAVTFDGPWEAYIRVLWQRVGTLLDLIFCSTDGYVVAATHSFEQWLGWARRVQVETDFFYGPGASSAHDLLYLRRVQLMRQAATPPALLALQEQRAVMPDALVATERLVDQLERVADDPPIEIIDTFQMARQRVRQGLQALAAFYRLVDLFPPGTTDNHEPVLRRAVLDLLREFVQLRDSHVVDDELAEQRLRFARALDWLFPDAAAALPRPVRVPPPEPYAVPPAVRAEVQGGVLRGYERITHGAVLLLSLDTPAAARALLDAALPQLTHDDQPHDAPAGSVYRNLAFTAAGLRACALDEDTLELFPEEFRQGMAARAGLLGDVRHNHPRRWRLPRRFSGIDAAPGDELIELGAVHAVLTLRCAAADAAQAAALELNEAAHPLRAEVAAWAARHAGLRVLSVQPLRRRVRRRNDEDVIVEHFGYADGQSQPELESGGSSSLANRVHLGELLWGHANGSDAAVDAADARHAWLFNGSFLVLRKYRQFVGRLHAAVLACAEQMRQQLGGDLNVHVETVYAKLMGRRRDGMPLMATERGRPNDFDYRDDPQGRACPLASHIRRANPRQASVGSERLPRLMRRSMSYGPAADGAEAERGIVFMAYQQSLSEQFEVVQRWLAGGNSTGIASAASCPIVGVPENGYPRRFRFEHADGGGQVHLFDVELEPRSALFETPAVATQLEWGLYLFAPSFQALAKLRAAADAAASRAPGAAVPWRAALGQKLLARLAAFEPLPGDADDVKKAKAAAAVAAWKTAVEDPGAIDRLYAASIWAALREHHGGVLKTSYGTLVAERELAAQVLLDPHKRYSVSGQRERMGQGFGEIYLGLDAGPQYEAESSAMNDAIGQLGFDAVFTLARTSASHKIDAIVAEAREDAIDFGEARFEALFDARELMDHVLADLCEAWFGVNDGPPGEALLQRGGVDWAWREGQPMLYPGHFTALSRHMFQPHPGAVPKQLGPKYGQALRVALRRFVQWHSEHDTLPRAPGAAQPAPLAQAAFAYLAQSGPPGQPGRDADFVARLIIGVLMGAIPTTIGAVLNVLLQWRREAQFETLRTALHGRDDAVSARDVLLPALRAAVQMRPMPQLNWRTVAKEHQLEGSDGRTVALAPGEIVVVANVSGTQQSLADGRPDHDLMFGGQRANSPHPTHACPGYDAAVASMLGSLSALLGRSGLREGPSPLSYVIAGASGVAPLPELARGSAALLQAARGGALVPQLAAAGLATLARREALNLDAPGITPRITPSNTLRTDVPQPGSRSGLLLCWGDSWLSYELGLSFGMDLRDWLANFGYRAPKDFGDWFKWGTVQAMAADSDAFCAALRASISSSARPRAVLLSGGGNDSTGAKLRALINRRGSGEPVLDAAKVAAHVARLRGHYETLLRAIAQVLQDKHAQALVPVLLHGYDHPIPAGQGLPFKRKWLYRPFVEAGYTDANGAIDLPVASAAMAGLIDALNLMQIDLQQRFDFVRHVDLRGTIAAHHAGQALAGWNDDLHPQDDMFKLMAAKVDDAMA